MAASLSTSPDTLIESLLKDYKVKVQGSELVLQTLEDKPVMQDGKPVPFEREALMKLLLSTKGSIEADAVQLHPYRITRQRSGPGERQAYQRRAQAVSSSFGFGKSFNK